MSIRNWAGMDIRVGEVVWRGARDGNTSTYKIGVVESLNGQKRVARVNWLFEEGYTDWLVRGYILPERYKHLPNVRRVKGSSGSPTVDSLAIIDIDLNVLDKHCREWDDLRREAEQLRESGIPRLDSHQ